LISSIWSIDFSLAVYASAKSRTKQANLLHRGFVVDSIAYARCCIGRGPRASRGNVAELLLYTERDQYKKNTEDEDDKYDM
jgi:hypothetical protein